MRYYIIAGEASGDLHGSNLIKAIKQKDAHAEFRYWGGDLMHTQGGQLVRHYKDIAYMGFFEVLKNIRTILKNIKFCKNDILEHQPDALILIDYPGFNLRIAEFAKKNNINVFYYISPQVWAWNKSRVHLIKKVVDKMLVILPFEESFYAQYNYKVYFVGHPLLDAIEENFSFDSRNAPVFETTDKPIIALLPGSRKQEIEKMLPKMLSLRQRFTDYEFVVCAVSSINKEIYLNICNDKSVKIVTNNTYDVLSKAHAAVVTSGTATLETALFNVPQVVCYHANYFSYVIAKNLVKLKYISLVNLILDKKVVTELIQKDFNVKNLEKELRLIVEDSDNRNKMQDYYAILKQKLGGKGASEKAATIIHEHLTNIK